MMKVAFAYWENRIAPVFDVSCRLHVVEVESGSILAEKDERLADERTESKALDLARLGVCVLVCGAISRPFQQLIAAYGIQVIPFIAGELSEVIPAWLNSGLENGAFAMPGCCCQRLGGRHKRWRGAGGESRLNDNLKITKGSRTSGTAECDQQRMTGALSRSAGGVCRCPQCGHSEPHKRGTPCVTRQCPKCGAALTRA